MTAPNADRKKTLFVLAFAVLVLAVAFGLRAYEGWKARRLILAEATVRGRTFTVEIADTDAKREKGLGEREDLAADRGMYFPFPSADYWIFWMKGMRFPIDIIWLRDNTVVDIDTNVPVPRGSELETYSPAEPADAVLELRAGIAGELGLKTGDELVLTPLKK